LYYSWNQTEHVNTGCGQNAKCSVLKLPVRLATTSLAGLRSACFNEHRVLKCGPGSVVGIATGYGLDGLGIESRWGARFSSPVQTGHWAHPASCTIGTGSFPRVKSGRGVMLTPHPLLVPWSRRVELYLYSPCGSYGLYRASVPVQGYTLPLLTYVLRCVVRRRLNTRCADFIMYLCRSEFVAWCGVAGYY
jgi:hypothetical protein